MKNNYTRKKKKNRRAVKIHTPIDDQEEEEERANRIEMWESSRGVCTDCLPPPPPPSAVPLKRAGMQLNCESTHTSALPLPSQPKLENC